MSGILPTAFQTGQQDADKLKDQLETEISILRGKCALAKVYCETNRKNYAADSQYSTSTESLRKGGAKKSNSNLPRNRKYLETPTVICHKRPSQFSSSQNGLGYPSAEYIHIRAEPRSENILEEVTAADVAAMEMEIHSQLRENMVKVQEQRDIEAKVRFRAAMEKKQLEEEYSRILKLLDEAQRAYRLEQLEAKTYKPQESVAKCQPVDKMIKKDFQYTLERQVEQIFKSGSREHAIEDVEGYDDEFEKRYYQNDKKPTSPCFEDIAYDSLLAKDNFEEKYFLNREQDVEDDVLNTAYMDSPPSLENSASESSEANVSTADAVDGSKNKSHEKRNAAVQAESPVLVESKGVQADVVQSATELKKKASSRHSKQEGAIHTPRKCFDVVRDHLFGKEMDSSTEDTSGSTVYHPLPPRHGIPIFPSLYQTDAAKQNKSSEEVSINSQSENRISLSRSDPSISINGAKPKQVFNADSCSGSSRLLPPLSSDPAKPPANIASYLNHIASKYEMKNGIRSTESTRALVCAIPLCEPIRKRPGKILPEDLDERGDAPQESNSSACASTLETATEQSSCEDVLGIESVPRSKRVASLSLMANLSQESDSSVNMTNGSINVTNTSPADLTSAEEKNGDLGQLKSIREFLLVQLKKKYPTLLDDEDTGVDLAQKDSKLTGENLQVAVDQVLSRDMPFIYHELSTIQEMDSAVVGDESRRSSKEKSSSELYIHTTKYPLTSLLANGEADLSHVLGNVTILPLESSEEPVSVETLNDSKDSSIPSVKPGLPEPTSVSTLSPNAAAVENILLKAAEDLSVHGSTLSSMIYPIIPVPSDNGNSLIIHDLGDSNLSFKPLTPQHIKHDNEKCNLHVSGRVTGNSSNVSSMKPLTPHVRSACSDKNEEKNVNDRVKNQNAQYFQDESSEDQTAAGCTSSDRNVIRRSSGISESGTGSFESENPELLFKSLTPHHCPGLSVNNKELNSRGASGRPLSLGSCNDDMSFQPLTPHLQFGCKRDMNSKISYQQSDCHPSSYSGSFSALQGRLQKIENSEKLSTKCSAEVPRGKPDTGNLGFGDFSLKKVTQHSVSSASNSSRYSSSSKPEPASGATTVGRAVLPQSQDLVGCDVPRMPAALRGIVDKQRASYYKNAETNSCSDRYSMLTIATLNMTLKRKMSRAEISNKGQTDQPVTDLIARITAHSSSSDDSLSGMFSASKIAFQSTPIRSEEELSNDEGILEQEEITLIGDELTLQRTVAQEKLVEHSYMSLHKSSISPQNLKPSGSSGSDEVFTSPQNVAATAFRDREQLERKSELCCAQPEERLSLSMISFLGHEFSAAQTPDHEHVSLISSEPSSTPTSSQFDGSNESTPQCSGSGSGGHSSRASTVRRQRSLKKSGIPTLSLPSEDYKRRTKRLWNNLAEVKAKKEVEDKKNNFMLNKRKVKELQEKLQAQRKPSKGRIKKPK